MCRKLAVGAAHEHPADHESTEDGDHHEQREPHAVLRSADLGDVPSEDLARRRREQFRLAVFGMSGETSPVADLATGAQNPVHRADRAQVDAFVESWTATCAGARSTNRSLSSTSSTALRSSSLTDSSGDTFARARPSRQRLSCGGQASTGSCRARCNRALGQITGESERRRVQSFSSNSGALELQPQEPRGFFRISSYSSNRALRRRRSRISRSSSLIRCASASCASRAAERMRTVSTSSSPRSRARRHV